MSDDRERSFEDRLRDLRALHADGLMTDDEYAKKLQLVVDQLGDTEPTPSSPPPGDSSLPPVKSQTSATPKTNPYEKRCATPGCYKKQTVGEFCTQHGRRKTVVVPSAPKKSSRLRKAIVVALPIVIFLVLLYAFAGGNSSPTDSPTAAPAGTAAPAADAATPAPGSNTPTSPATSRTTTSPTSSSSAEFARFLQLRLFDTSYSIDSLTTEFGKIEIQVYTYSAEKICSDLAAGASESELRRATALVEVTGEPTLDTDIPIFVDVIFEAAKNYVCS